MAALGSRVVTGVLCGRMEACQLLEGMSFRPSSLRFRYLYTNWILTRIRFKDMIIRGGENIAPAAIEAVLNQFPGVDVNTPKT